MNECLVQNKQFSQVEYGMKSFKQGLLLVWNDYMVTQVDITFSCWTTLNIFCSQYTDVIGFYLAQLISYI